jgi:AcrR family transcriptional regulator
MRADARRNRERLLAAATEAFAEHGAEASLDEIARRAGVGPGTLYRHFPTRLALQEAAYREGVERLCGRANELAEKLEPGEALAAWLRNVIDYLGEKRGLSAALLTTQDKSSELFTSCHDALYAAGGKLLEEARATGWIRPDVTLVEILKLVNGIGLTTEQLADRAEQAEQAERLLGIVLDGLCVSSSGRAALAFGDGLGSS